MKKKILAGTALLALAWIGAAAESQEKEYSGFLEDYSILQPHPDRENVLFYKSERFDPKDFDKYIVEPIEIWFHADSEYKGVAPDKLVALSDGLIKALEKEIADAYPFVQEPGEGVGVIRIAMTEVLAKKKKRMKWYSFTPVGAVATGAKAAATEGFSIAGASLEVEMRDSLTGELMAAFVDFNVGEKLREKRAKGKNPDTTSWADVEETMEYWAKRIRERMDASRGR
ncbi:MAG: DUF3313 domain-containing protein [Acidobacteriota bacterium]